MKQIAYVAKKCEEIGCKLIVGSIREPEDVIKIIRKSPTAGESIFYRVVTNV